MDQDATYLTEKYPGEQTFWEPLLVRFFAQNTNRLKLKVYQIDADQHDRRFRLRLAKPYFAVTRAMAQQLFGDRLLAPIEEATGLKLRDDPRRYLRPGMDDAGIKVDLLHVDGPSVTLLEIKPFDTSEFSGNHLAGGSYPRFVRWLGSRGIDCQYLFAMPYAAMWKKGSEFNDLQCELGLAFGFVLFEDIFSEMSRCGFKYEGISEPWEDYVKKEAQYFPQQ